MVASALPFKAGLSVLEVKALAFLRGVELALEIDIQPFIVESDSATVVNIFDGSSFSNIVFVPRSANMAAHGLTKLALKVVGDLVWMEDVLSNFVTPFAKNVVLLD
ncbi:hypothetical protein ACOSQ3_007784 [Xanthoceras sorbifolium]